MKVRFYEIVWDTSDDDDDEDTEQPDLPAELTLEVDDDEDAHTLNEFGADRLSEETGFLVESFSWQTLPASGPSLSSYDNTKPALQAALNAFRSMYERMEGGDDTEDILEDESLWPLTQLREALGQPE